MKLFLTLSCLVFTFTVSADAIETNPDTTSSILNKAKVKVWMAEARHKMFERDWRGALGGYQEVLAVDKGNAKAEFRTAQCQYELMVYKYALQHLKKAEEIAGVGVDKEFYYIQGKIYQRLGELDKAIESYESFIKIVGDEPSKEEEYMTKKYIDDCKYAKEVMLSPLMVDINGVGEEVNSRFREYGAVLSPDGKEMYFSSRRQDTYGGNLAGDKVYFSDIYVSKWNEITSSWGPCENLEGKGNTEEFDDVTDVRLLDNGTLMLYVTYNIAGWTRASDIGYTKRSSKGTWSKPKLEKKRKGKKGGINTTFFETSASVTADGNTMCFVAESLKGVGQSDIYIAQKDGSKWGVPIMLDTVVNTIYDENTAWISPDGSHIFFSSNGIKGVGGYDIYVTKKTESGWSKPRNLGYPINSIGNDTHFRLSPNGNKAYVTSGRNGGRGMLDIYEIDLKEESVYKD